MDRGERWTCHGILQDMMRIPQVHQTTVLQRIKNLADMDAAAQRMPQEGRFLIVHRGRRLDVRVSTLPTYFGEKVLIRILDPRSTLRTLEQLGMARHHEDALKRILSFPQGMLVVTGPTASGKSIASRTPRRASHRWQARSPAQERHRNRTCP